MKRLVIGILAHVDAGKTTLSEALLYRSGARKTLGRVDHGDAFLDSFDLERERGITIFAKQALLPLQETEITLLDTPGHVDFSPEMERTLQVLDAAILVISGTDGVQSHTETLWQLLARRHIPTFLFVNKMDLAGADRAALLAELGCRLNSCCIDFSAPRRAVWAEQIALCDEALLDPFLETGTVAPAAVCAAIARCTVFPCYFGSALKLSGVDDFLAGLEQYAVPPVYPAAFGAKIFQISRDAQGNRLTHLKITGGTLKVRDLLAGEDRAGSPWAEKANQLRRYSGPKFQSVDEALPGMVCAVTGLTHTYPGMGLGAEPGERTPLLQPILTYRVELPPGTDARTALAKLRLLEEEEPQLHVTWRAGLQEIHVQLMGAVQLEVLERLIADRFQLAVTFGTGSIVYQETIADTVEGVGHFEPLRHYAEVHLLLEPGARGSGLVFASACGEDLLDKSWQRLVLTHLAEKQHLGVLTGAALTDVKITLVAGHGHEKHTEGGDFRQATYRAVRQGLRQAQSVLLEPWYRFRLEVPQTALGRAMSDLQRRDVAFTPGADVGALAQLLGSAPVAVLQDYQREVTSYTHGVGRLICTPQGYAPCHNTAEIVAACGYDCDSDLENTADSVFCAHGAGVVVRWDAVPAQMHLPFVRPPATQPVAGAVTPQRVSGFCDRLAEDKELMAIYERTYGPIRRDPRAAFRAAPKPAEASCSPVPREIRTGPEYLLVDGYNIIFAWDDLKALAQENLESARNRLINILCNYQAYRQCELILVFDAYKVKGNPGEVEKYHNISVVYTKEAETADMYIEKVTHTLGKNYRVRVATSDGLEQLIVLSHGALRVPARVFQDEVNQIEQEIRRFLVPQ